MSTHLSARGFNRGHHEQTWRVIGQVLRADGSPVAKARVRVQRQGIRTTDGVAPNHTAGTGDDGRFVIEYPRPRRPLDLRVELLPDPRLGIGATRPRIIGGAGPQEQIDFVVNDEPYRGPSAVERLSAALSAVLDEEEIALTELPTLEDVERALLAAKSGVDPSEVVLLTQSMTLAAETGVAAEIFYGLGKQKVPLALTTVLALGPERRRQAAEAALRKNLIPQRMSGSVEQALSTLDQLSLQHALADDGRVGALLGLAGLDDARRQRLAELYLDEKAAPDAFWKRVRDDGELDEAQIQRAQTVLQLGAITQNHPPLVEALLGEQVEVAADTARFDLSDWQRFVDGADGSTGAGVPADLAAAGVSHDGYAAMIHAAVEDAFPTQVIAHRVADLPDGVLLGSFFADNPDYDLRKPLVSYLRAHPSALDSAGDAAPALERRLKGIERLHRIAPPAALVGTVQRLLPDGLDSAQKIRSLGKAAFLHRYADALGAERAESIWARAGQASALATTLLARHGAMFDTTPLPVLAPRPDSVAGFAEFETLFGSLDFCGCEHCQSIYSPAAYLVDLLYWLGNQPAAGAGSALDLLLKDRRGDLETIELSCKNTNTELPYLDLVNEVLELAVAPPDEPANYQTSGSAADLRAHPEHVRDQAYVVLSGAAAPDGDDAVHPFHLPFDLWLEEARIYLGQLGLARYRLMEACLGRAAAAGDAAVAAECLGMSPLEWDIVAGNALAPSRSLAALWGQAEGTNLSQALLGVPAFLAAARTADGAAMSFDELTDLLRTDFVQAAGQLGIWFERPCDTTTATLPGLDEAHLGSIHRFVRLRRRLGWSAANLDRAIQVLGNGVLDEAALIAIANVVRACDALRLSVDEMLTWWAPIDTRRWQARLQPGRPAAAPNDPDGSGLVFDARLSPQPADGDGVSPYDRLFQSGTTKPASAFGVAASGDALVDEAVALADHTAAIAAALEVTAADVERLVPRLASDRLSMANLSALRRHVLAARALGVSIADLVAWLDVTGIDPFDGSATDNPLRLADELRANRAAGVPASELGYLLRHVESGPLVLAPRPDAVGTLLLGLRGMLRAGATRPAAIDRVAQAVGLEVRVAARLVETYLHHPDAAGPSLIDVLTADEVRDYDRVEPGSEAPALPTAEDLPQQFAAYERLHKVALVLRRFRITAAEVSWVMETGPARGAVDLGSLPLAPSATADTYAAWARLRDAVALRDRSTSGALFDLFERAASAEAAGDPAETAAARAALIAELEARMAWSHADLEFLIGTPATAGALGLSYPADFADERGVRRASDVLTLVARVGLGAPILWPWREVPRAADDSTTANEAAANARAAQARQIVQAVRARYEPATWLEIAASLRDRLRVRQRDALVGWLSNPGRGFAQADELSGHLLLDVEMSPCQQTSRIAQAIASVQAFVQRTLLGREPDGGGNLLELSSEAAREWAWMKSYRVWEANRKVFLYPENWIEPELRDDKTPFFEELEADLLQGEVTEDAAQRAVLDYLGKLHEVSRLDILAVSRQVTGNGEVLHLFGRTRATPPRYYYRRREATGRWTPWEASLPDIDGDQLLPVWRDGVLHLFWLQIREVASEEVPDIPEQWGRDHNTQSSPARSYALRLAWSTRRAGKWSGKKVSTQEIAAAGRDRALLQHALFINEHSRPSDFFLCSYQEGGDLIVEPVRWFVENDAYAHCQRLRRFRVSGCDSTLSLELTSSDPGGSIQKSDDMTPSNQGFAQPSAGALRIIAVDPLTSKRGEQPVLATTRSPCEVVPVGMADLGSGNPFVYSDYPFVYQDRTRTFLVTPRGRLRPRLPQFPQPDAIALDVDRLLGEVAPRPRVPAPNPWATDPATRIRTADPLRIAGVSSLVPAPGADAASGLASISARSVAETLDARVASVGSEVVASRPNRLAVRATATIVGEDGRELAVMRSAQPPATSGELRTVELDSSFPMPSIRVSDVATGLAIGAPAGKRFRFEDLYHPFVCPLVERAERVGPAGLFDSTGTLARQTLARDFFQATYAPATVDAPFPVEQLDFSHDGAYSIYNWELFFHLPFLIATHLGRNQRFEDAQRWFHYVFDPTAGGTEPAPRRFWKTKPFYETFAGDEAGSIVELLLLLQYDGNDPAKLHARDQVARQVAEWRRNPFEPHAIARLRPAAYQKAVVMKYVDNLIDWGDQLFGRDTRESVGEAAQIYQLAAAILGPRPRRVPTRPPTPRTFAELRAAGLDQLANALVEAIESFLPEATNDATNDPTDHDGGTDAPVPPVLGPSLYFCVPPNQTLLSGYWDRVADRLFKIRHCMNIEGKVREIPLFEPPIEPGLLVRARAAGVDLRSALATLEIPSPRHRYAVLAQHARELCGDVRSLGQALLGALERRDAEEVALLRASHERDLLAATRGIRERQVEEALDTLASLQRSQENARVRLAYYQSRTLMNASEEAQLELLLEAGAFDLLAGAASLGGASAGTVPDLTIGAAGFGGSPMVTTTAGGSLAVNVAGSIAGYLRTGAVALDRAGQLAGLMGGYLRRMDDWNLQARIAEKEIESLEQQIMAAELRVAITERERDNLELQIAQAKQADDFLRNKFTNAELYHWMVEQLSALYFQSYQLAYRMARRAEKAWQRELAQPDRRFIDIAYWDSLKKGLLAGDRLHLDLQRMESARLDADVREYELTRHVSLRDLDPLALFALRKAGECVIRVPEAWLDLDSPGHYLRRIKMVAVSLPSVTGPYVPVRCTLTLLRSSTRVSPDVGPGYARTGPDDGRFADDPTAVESIVTSHAVKDPGLFETNLRDERYLPFEGAGAISEWRLELPRELRQFDYDTISDVVLHVRYTARSAGAELRQAAEAELRAAVDAVVLGSEADAPAGEREGLLHLVSARRDLSDAWARWMHPPDDQPDQTLTMRFDAESLPFALGTGMLEVLGVDLFLSLADVTGYGDGSLVRLQLSPPGGSAQPVDLGAASELFGGIPRGHLVFGGAPVALGDWSVAFRESDNASASSTVVIDENGHRRLDPSKVLDLVAIFRYRIAT